MDVAHRADGVEIYCGDALETAREFPDNYFHAIITSPPYWNLRTYDGGDNQIGAEETADQYIARLLSLFRELRRTLHPTGTLWLNLGDCYVDKQLQGLPWRVALTLQSDGWILRQDIIWSKPNPLPMPVRDRCLGSHEHLFLFAKSRKYFFDYAAIQEPCVDQRFLKMGSHKNKPDALYLADNVKGRMRGGMSHIDSRPMRNKRDVWRISVQPSGVAHFAAFPAKLVEPCVLAGASEFGCCSTCGAPLRRVVSSHRYVTRSPKSTKLDLAENALDAGARDPLRRMTVIQSLGCQSTCDCQPLSIIPCRVLDPFCGSGTTLAVSQRLGRHSVGVDLSGKYCQYSFDRVKQFRLRFDQPTQETS